MKWKQISVVIAGFVILLAVSVFLALGEQYGWIDREFYITTHYVYICPTIGTSENPEPSTECSRVAADYNYIGGEEKVSKVYFTDRRALTFENCHINSDTRRGVCYESGAYDGNGNEDNSKIWSVELTVPEKTRQQGLPSKILDILGTIKNFIWGNS